jgi:ABC-2 type transport system permease protein
MIANFLYVGLRKLFDMLVIMVCYGVTEYSSLGKSGFLSPLYYLTTQVKVSTIYSDAGMYTDGSGNYGTTVASGIAISGLGLVAIYAVIGVVLVAVAYLLYQRRKIEAAGDLITIGIVKPIFRWGVAICCGFGAAMIVVAILREYDLAQSTAALYPAVVVFGAIFFFLAQMLLDKSFHVFQKPFLRECAVMVVVLVAALGVIDADLFGIESYVPDYDNIEAAFVYMDYPLQIADEDMEEFLALHREVITHCDEFSRLSHEPSGYYYTTFCYYLKNGSKVTRQYAIPLAEDVADGSIAGAILSWETDPSNVKKNLLGTYWEENEYLSMSIDLVNDEGDSYDRFFSDEEMARMLDAVMQDIEDGNFACTYLEREQEASESYYNSIRYTYQNPYYYNDQWYYYDDYFESMQENDTAVMRNDSTSTNYISFSPSCTHIIETLEDMGISADEAWDGEWSLKTYTQMEEIWETS